MLGTDLNTSTDEPDAAPLSDDELTALALAADPEAPVAADAVSLWDLTSRSAVALLPDWYMPGPMARTRLLEGWKRRVVIGLIVAFLVIDAAGLCFTYGSVIPA